MACAKASQGARRIARVSPVRPSARSFCHCPRCMACLHWVSVQSDGSFRPTLDQSQGRSHGRRGRFSRDCILGANGDGVRSLLVPFQKARQTPGMARPLRIEFAGALCHLTCRGDRREAIFEDDEDRETFLGVCAEVAARYHWRCYAYCVMPDHYHPLLETVEGRLSQGMRHLNGVHTQASNRRHRKAGHLFQGRFPGMLVDKDAYLLEWSRYGARNPVRAKIVDTPEEWSGSSYRATVGTAAPTD